jgi:hypothetical protein
MPFAATSIQLGLLLDPGVVMTALKLLAALNTCDRAIKAATSTGRSVTKYKVVQFYPWRGHHEIRRSLSSIPGESPKLRIPMRHDNRSILR